MHRNSELARSVPMIRKPKDFWMGVLLFAIAFAAFYLSQEVPFGTSRRMGPGYFPTMLSFLLAGFGLILVIRSFIGTVEEMQIIRLKAPVLVIAGIVTFAFLIRNAGLVIAIVSMVLIAAPAAGGFRYWQILIVATVLALGSVVVFVLALGQPMPVFGNWFGR